MSSIIMPQKQDFDTGAISAIKARLDVFLALQDGWDDGYGKKFSRDWIGELVSLIENNYPEKIPTPTVMPLSEGGVSFEWDKNDSHFLLEISDKHQSTEDFCSAKFYKMDLSTSSCESHSIEITNPKGWNFIVD